MSGQDGKVRYYRLQTEGKTNVHFQGKDVYCGNLKTAFNSVCSWPVCAALLLLLWMTWFLVWLSSNALLVSEIGKNLTVVRIPKSTADKTAAFCLDGSSPAYYFRRGRKNKWVIHFPTSELCFSLEQCMQLSRNNGGSSLNLAPSLSVDGFLSSNSDVNPDFFDWNVALLHTCDGGLYTVGAQAVYLHLDFIKEQLQPNTQISGLADSGFFVDALNKTRFPQMKGAMKLLYVTHKSRESLNKKCLAVNTAQFSEWSCLIPGNMYKFISTPMFLVDSFFNAWSVWFTLDLRCYPPSCKDHISELTSHALERQEGIQQVVRSNRDGLYITSCFENDFILSNKTWNEAIVNNTVLREAFVSWYRRDGIHWWNITDCFSFYACNPRCDWSPRHFLEAADHFRSQPDFYTAKQ